MAISHRGRVFAFVLYSALTLCRLGVVSAGPAKKPVALSEGKIAQKRHGRSAAVVVPVGLNEKVIQKQESNDLVMGVLAIIGGMLCHMVLGTLYCFGNFLAYLPPHLQYFKGVPPPEGGQPDALGVIPLTIVFQTIAMPLGAQIAKRLGTRVASLTSGTLIATAVYTSSYAKTLSTFMVLYSALFGFGVGIGYTSPMIAAWTWFPKSRGLCNGLVLLGYGCGGFLANMLGSHFVNPGGAMKINPATGQFPQQVYDTFPSMLRRLALIYACASALGGSRVVSKKKVKQVLEEINSEMSPPAALLKEKRRLFGIIPLGTKVKSISESIQSTPKRIIVKSLSLGQAARTSTFWALYGIVILSASTGITLASIYKLFATASPTVSVAGDQYLATIGALGSLSNGIGRLGWASAVDAFGYKKPSFVLLLMQALNTALYPLAARTSPAAYMVATCVSYFLLGGIFSTTPTCCALAFGPDSAALIYGVLFSGFAIASISGVQLAKSLIPTLGWTSLYRALALTTLLAAPLISLLQVPS